MKINNFAIAVTELIRDYHVTRKHADAGFTRAMLKSFAVIMLGMYQ